jgi:hypothetical protein
MGCTSSKSTAAQPSSAAMRAKNNRAGLNPLKSQDQMKQSDVNQMKEDLLQRQDSEVNLLSQIAEERQLLKSIAEVTIERRSSCEDLMETLTRAQFAQIHDFKWRRALQREFYTEKMKRNRKNDDGRKAWVVSERLHRTRTNFL